MLLLTRLGGRLLGGGWAGRALCRDTAEGGSAVSPSAPDRKQPFSLFWFSATLPTSHLANPRCPGARPRAGCWALAASEPERAVPSRHRAQSSPRSQPRPGGEPSAGCAGVGSIIPPALRRTAVPTARLFISAGKACRCAALPAVPASLALNAALLLSQAGGSLTETHWRIFCEHWLCSEQDSGSN